MDYRNLKNALNRFLGKYVGGENRPTFHSIDDTCPTLNELTTNYSVIKQEFQKVLVEREKLPLYHEIDPGETEISGSTQQKWQVYLLYLMGYSLPGSRATCPETFHMLKKIPNLMQAFFSILEPGKSIPLHRGPYLGYLRYHLGLEIPENDPPCIYVNSQPYVWKEGEAVLFDDSWPHEIINKSDSLRAVLIVDILRPLPLFPAFINWIATNIIARFGYGKQVVKRFRGFIEKSA